MPPPALSLPQATQQFLLWEAASRDIISVKRCYIDIAGGDIIAGILLSQILYWYLPSAEGKNDKLSILRDEKRWLAKKRDDWWDECRISPKQFDRASILLENLQLIERQVFRFNGSPTMHLAVNFPVLLERVNSILTKGEEPTSLKGNFDIDQRGRTRARQDPESSELDPETTAETTKTNTPLPPTGECSPSESLVVKTPRRKSLPFPGTQEVLDYLCAVTHRHYTNGDQINTLLRTGVSVDECRLVIDWIEGVQRTARPEWYAEYFDNVTPFRPGNFDKYRARALAWREAQYPSAHPHPSRRAFVDGEAIDIIQRKVVL